MTRVQLYLVIVQIFLLKSEAASSSSSSSSNDPLKVLAVDNSPFMHRNKNGNIDRGIEYKLIQTIAQKSHLNVTFFDQKHFKIQKIRSLRIDLFVGGLFPNTSLLDTFAFSKTYYQDRLMWCVQKSTNYPMSINLFLAAKPEVWLIGFIVGIGVSGLITYIMIPFDLMNKRRNFIDMNYVLILIMMPMVIGSNLRHFPKMLPCRSLYAYSLLTTFFLWQLLFCYGGKFITIPTPRPQISTVHEIIERNFRIAGSNAVYDMILHDKNVKFFFL